MREDQIRERIEALRDEQTDHEMAVDAIISELDDLEYELAQIEEEWDDVQADDDRQRAADMNATLRDIGSTQL
jgi:predicted nuclease with TOPRIM domain